MFQIDFFELCFLAEACIPPAPIARATFWLNLIDRYYDQMNPEQRKKLFEWMTRLDKLNLEIEEHLLFHNRYNPANQYLVTATVEDHEAIKAFRHNSRYYVSSTRYVEPKFVLKVEKLITLKT